MNKYNLIQLCIILLMASCSGMNDNIREYLDRGEANYIGAPDSVKAYGGRNRVQFKWKVNADPRIENFIVTWKNTLTGEADTLTCPVNRAELVKNYQTHIFDIPSTNQGTFVFYVYHTGSEGLPSMKYEVSGSVYGTKYQSSLIARRVTSITATATECVIKWGSNNGCDHLLLSYTDAAGVAQSVTVLAADSQTTLSNVPLGSKISIKTYYLPEKNAIDMFFVESEIQVPQATAN